MSAWFEGERPTDVAYNVRRPLALPPFLSDSELAEVSMSFLKCFDPDRLRSIMQEHGFAIVTDVLTAQECSELTVCHVLGLPLISIMHA